MRTALLVLPALLLGVTAGSSDPKPAPAAAGGPVAARAADDACELDSTDLAPGRNVLQITNDGSQVTGVYVYGEGDRVVTEKEDIGPGTATSSPPSSTRGSTSSPASPA